MNETHDDRGSSGTEVGRECFGSEAAAAPSDAPGLIYLDNAATSWPKPPEVIRAMAEFLERAGGNPGRSGHRLSIEAARIIYDAREAVARLLGASDPARVIFTLNASHALNLVLHGLLRPGDKVVTGRLEHNSVMRPLRTLERTGVTVLTVGSSDGGGTTADDVRSAGPGVRLVVIGHGSNVSGRLQPLEAIAAAAHDIGALLLVDAAQTAGAVELNMERAGLDMLAFTGHKALLGPPGTGGLILGSRVDPSLIEPQFQGGTGSSSEFEEQPAVLPDKFEAGTSNGVGIAGLRAGIRFVERLGVPAIRQKEMELAERLLEGLSVIPGVAVHGLGEEAERTATVSFTVEGRRVSEIGLRLDDEYGILTRVGLHCSPAAHRTLGTFPEGTVRLAPGVFTTPADIDRTLLAIQAIVAG